MRTEYPCKILVIEDDAGICRFLRATLTAAHYDVIVTDTGKKALEIVSSHCPDCILLDLGLPDLDGNDIIQSIRGWTTTPIIVISARSTEEDKARALDLGADDYLTKPFGSIELMARIRTALRHTRTTMENDSIALSGVYTVRGLTVDYKKHRVFMNGTDTGLTPNEYRIVALLGHLRAGQAEVIRMVKLEGRSIKEAADLSGQSESLVKVNIHRGILAMRAMLGGDLAFA